MDHCKLKDEIIRFVRNSPEEVVSKVAVFIAGMQAQKSLEDCRREAGNGLSVVKDGSGGKEGG
jgi:protein-tyrosine phosphatase